ncbi:hypothetical protein TWF594_010864 [Orbilia oligospora]|uniref:Uncharacterized protein n=1 Tax=Orbilia oligospora TaxID=2813651 RepID=A0A7C8JY35_ORBOL|nr:hypothetical protein TWF103_002159 [Orbilia oligospora]KAF3125969.1 hypothetical protein TWF703_010616 [Orbilia oligospora]KAF3129743.1 hypothetical protein TWF594_010864 [Orbilia oligospora]
MTFLAVFSVIQATYGAPASIPSVDAAAGDITGLSPREPSLPDDLQEFTDKIPVDKVNDIVMSYLGDAEVLEPLNYILTDPFIKDEEIEAIPEFTKFLNHKNKENFKIYDLVNKVNEFLGLESLVPPPTRTS